MIENTNETIEHEIHTMEIQFDNMFREWPVFWVEEAFERSINKQMKALGAEARYRGIYYDVDK